MSRRLLEIYFKNGDLPYQKYAHITYPAKDQDQWRLKFSNLGAPAQVLGASTHNQHVTFHREKGKGKGKETQQELLHIA